MLAIAEIQSIDYNSNSCTVRLPVFETVMSEFPAVVTAKFVSLPGIFNGYLVGDTVWVGFLNNWPGSPVILGKVYQGVATEAASDATGKLKIPGGTVHCSDFIAVNTAELPLNTKISGTETEYDSLAKIIAQLKHLNLYGNTGNNDIELGTSSSKIKPYSEEGELVGLEIDGTYYRLPGTENIDGGVASTPDSEYTSEYGGGNAGTFVNIVNGSGSSQQIPLPPDEDGKYRLECEVADGIIVYSWVAIE